MTAIKFHKPEPLNIGKEGVFEIGEWMSQKHKYTPESDLWEIVTDQLGGKIDLKDFSRIKEDASIYVSGVADFRIELPYALPSESERFCLAHEIGHYVLHYLVPYSQNGNMLPMKAHRYGNELTEFEANWFAAAYLLPKSEYGREFTASNGDHSVLARCFRVPLKLSQNRAKSLNLES